MVKTKIFVINLKKRPDRFKLFHKSCPIDISKINKFEAIDGITLKNTPYYFNNLKPGEIGCFLSHITLWKKLINEKNINYYVIFEDDTKFTNGFLEGLNHIFKNFNSFNTILYTGGRFTENYEMKNSINVINNIVKYDYNKKWNPYDCERTTHSYIISKKCCELFLKDFNERIKNDNIKKIFFPPIDIYMTFVLRINKKDIFHSYPLLCYSEIDSNSDIR